MFMIFAKLGRINIGDSSNLKILLLSLARQGTWGDWCVLQVDMKLFCMELYKTFLILLYWSFKILFTRQPKWKNKWKLEQKSVWVTNVYLLLNKLQYILWGALKP